MWDRVITTGTTAIMVTHTGIMDAHTTGTMDIMAARIIATATLITGRVGVAGTGTSPRGRGGGTPVSLPSSEANQASLGNV